MGLLKTLLQLKWKTMDNFDISYFELQEIQIAKWCADVLILEWCGHLGLWLTNFEKMVPNSYKVLPKGCIGPYGFREKDNDGGKTEHFSYRKNELLRFLGDHLIQTAHSGLKYHRAYSYGNTIIPVLPERNILQFAIGFSHLKSYLVIKISVIYKSIVLQWSH